MNTGYDTTPIRTFGCPDDMKDRLHTKLYINQCCHKASKMADRAAMSPDNTDNCPLVAELHILSSLQQCTRKSSVQIYSRPSQLEEHPRTICSVIPSMFASINITFFSQTSPGRHSWMRVLPSVGLRQLLWSRSVSPIQLKHWRPKHSGRIKPKMIRNDNSCCPIVLQLSMVISLSRKMNKIT